MKIQTMVIFMIFYENLNDTLLRVNYILMIDVFLATFLGGRIEWKVIVIGHVLSWREHHNFFIIVYVALNVLYTSKK